MPDNNEKITTLNLGDKKGVTILKSKYDMMSSAIIAVLKNKEQATLAELTDQLELDLRDKFDGKIGWYFMAVKLDLEVRQVIVRVPNKSPQTLTLN